jgi:hypothetical protein
MKGDQNMTAQELKTLVEHNADPCISIYLRTHTPGENVQQDILKLKHALHDAELRLSAENHRTGEISKLLAAPSRLLTDPPEWQQYHGGMAMFIAPGLFQYFHAPGVPSDLVTVSNAFHTKPLIPLLARNDRFHVLMLSKKQVRLFQGTADTFDELDIPPGVPRNMEEAMLDEDIQDNLQHHTAQTVGQGAIFGIKHGQAPDVFKPQERVFLFYRRIDHGLHDLLRAKEFPLLLAGVEENFAIYRRANTYPFLLEKGVTGSADEFHPPTLHKQAWAVLEATHREAQEKAVARYLELVGTGRTSEKLDEIVSAAYFGRVDHLFVALNGQRWGTFDPDSNRVEVHDDPKAGDRDLLDLAAAQTLLNGGAVYALDPGKVPGKEAEMAAVFRY